MNYVVGKVKRGSGACVLGMLKGVDKHYQLHQGVSRSANWPADAHYEMSKDQPKAIKLEDFVNNLNKFLVASERVVDLLREGAEGELEFLPVTIVNHKGRKEKAPYFVVHPLGLPDCIDQSRTRCVPNPIDPEVFTSVTDLTIDPTRVPQHLRLFRMRHYPYLDVWREDVASKVTAAGLTGRAFVKPAEWRL